MTINYSGLNDKGNEVNVFIKTKELQQKTQIGQKSASTLLRELSSRRQTTHSPATNR